MRGKFLRPCLFENVFILISYLIDSLARLEITFPQCFEVIAPLYFRLSVFLLKDFMPFWYFTVCIKSIMILSWNLNILKFPDEISSVKGFFRIEQYTQKTLSSLKIQILWLWRHFIELFLWIFSPLFFFLIFLFLELLFLFRCHVF